MRRIFFSIAIIITTFSLTSCFNIIEEVAITKKGSGTYKNTIDMSQMMGMISAFMPDSVKQMTGEMEKGMMASIDDLKNIKGISQYQYQ